MNTEHNVSENESVSFFMREEEDTYPVGFFRTVDQWLRLALSKVPKTYFYVG
jgi:hypothetical protein